MKKPSTITNIIFYGVGGQGVLTASEVCGVAAFLEGYHVKKTEVHGMAQRGGSVESHVRFGKKVFSPTIPYGEADFLVCLYPEEHGRFTSFLKKGGKDLFAVYAQAEAAVGENKKFINTFMLGALSSRLPLKDESWLTAIEKVFKGKFLDENRKVFLQGQKAGADL